jgi:hypothetical protein
VVILSARVALALAAWACTACGYEVAPTVDVHRAAEPAASSRDKLSWPFAIESIWNTPLGAAAQRVPAQMAPPASVGREKTYFVVVGATDPTRDVLEPVGKPQAPCSGTQRLDSVACPDDFVLSVEENRSLANATSLLMPDGHTLRELVDVARCEPGGPVFGYPGPTEDIYGLGLRGGQGGSGLSAVGGSLRAGELTGRFAIRHALKLDIWANRYLFFDPAAPASCYRWPADRCDTNAAEPAPAGYHGANPDFVQGSLLALPAQLTAAQLQLETEPGRLLFAALQDYGAYVVGDAGADQVLIALEAEAADDFAQTYGYEPKSDQPGSEAWAADVRKLVTSLDLITNNGPSSVGGGGTPRRQLAPPISN